MGSASLAKRLEEVVKDAKTRKGAAGIVYRLLKQAAKAVGQDPDEVYMVTEDIRVSWLPKHQTIKLYRVGWEGSPYYDFAIRAFLSGDGWYAEANYPFEFGFYPA